jgi:sterol desaturase/sphingolipid hydroxylase (fatty acid hydroxylase superfamily)
VHHYGFAGRNQEIHDVTELSVVMMPWYTLLMVFAMASPIALVAALIGGTALAGVFLIAAVGYFLLYETIHTLHHLPNKTLTRLGLGGNRVLTALRAHHHHHHQLENMARTNFNVTAPLADFVLGTYNAQK